MHKYFFSFFIMFAATSVYSQNSSHGYEIRGKVAGFPDSTILYFFKNKIHDAVKFDSAFIINNEFHFKGSLEDEAMQIILQTRRGDNFKFFWLENSVITFSSTSTNLKNAVIKGSGTQDEQVHFDSITRNNKMKMIQYIIDHPNSLISAFVFSIYGPAWGKDTSAMLYDKLGPKMKDNYFGKNISTFISLNKSPKIGDHYANINEPDSNGKMVRISDFTGKVLLLDFWGSWCLPCRANNPKLVEIYKEFNHAGFEILGIAADLEKKAWLAAIQKDGLPWPNVSELKGMDDTAAIIYGVHKYPTNFLIDKQGKIIAIDAEATELRNILLHLLQ